jgi:hypothetical protein
MLSEAPLDTVQSSPAAVYPKLRPGPPGCAQGGGKQQCFLATYDIVVRARLLGSHAAELELLTGELRRVLPEIEIVRNRMRSKANVTVTDLTEGPVPSGSYDEHSASHW